VRCIEFGHDTRHDFHFCALEYVDGENLGQIIRTRWQIPEKESIDIIRQVATALEYANLSNLIHRDVKPENVMVTAQGEAKLLDLGLARRTAKEATRLTDSGIFVGSPYYASPEQVLGDQKIDIRSDLYSLGATFYHMVTGRPPFGGTRTFEVLQKHVNQKLPWPADVNPELSDGVCRVIAKMMAKEPRDRYQTPTELVQDLDAVLHGNDSTVDDGVLRRSSISTSVRVRRRRHRPPSVKSPTMRDDAGRGRPRRRSRRAEDEGRSTAVRKKGSFGNQALIAFLVAAAATAATITVMLLMGR
jgi:serine/threonine-protein kinase